MNYNLTINALFKDNNVLVNLDKVETSLTNIDTGIDKVNNAFNSLSESINAIDYSAKLDLIDRAVHTLSGIAQPGIAFEKSMAELSAITGIAGADLKDLGATARQIGVETGLGADKAAAAFKYLASNIDVADIGIDGLKQLQKETIALAQAAGMTLPDAANALSATINQFGLGAGEAIKVINVLAASSKYGAAEVNELSQTFKVAGAGANAAGIKLEELAGAAEVLSKNAVKGAEAGTALRNIMLKMQTGLKVDFSVSSLSEELAKLQPKLTDVTYLSKLFGAENLNAAQYLIDNANAVAEMTDKVTGSSVATEQAAINTDTMAVKLEKIRAQMDEYKIELFELTDGYIAYAGALGEMLGGIASLISLLNVLKGVFNGVIWTIRLLSLAIYNIPLLGWILAAITGIVALYQYCDWFREKIDKYIIEPIKWLFNTLADWFGWDTSKAEKQGKADATAYKKGLDSITKSWDDVINPLQPKAFPGMILPGQGADKNKDKATAKGTPVVDQTAKSIVSGGMKNVTVNLRDIIGIQNLNTSTAETGLEAAGENLADSIARILAGAVVAV